MQAKVLWWVREMVDYYEVGKLGKNFLEKVKLSWESCIWGSCRWGREKTSVQRNSKSKRISVSYFNQQKINQPLRADLFVLWGPGLHCSLRLCFHIYFKFQSSHLSPIFVLLMILPMACSWLCWFYPLSFPFQNQNILSIVPHTKLFSSSFLFFFFFPATCISSLRTVHRDPGNLQV